MSFIDWRYHGFDGHGQYRGGNFRATSKFAADWRRRKISAGWERLEIFNATSGSSLDDLPEKAHHLTMTDDMRCTPEDWDDIGAFLANNPPTHVTVTTTPDIHAAQEALNVAVFRWLDAEQWSHDSSEELDRVRWHAAKLRSEINRDVF